jgi:hypothetical protein
MVTHGFRNQQNAPVKNYNCNAKSQDVSRTWSDAASLVQSIIKKIDASP